MKLNYFEQSGLKVRSIRLGNLDFNSCKKILISKGLADSDLLEDLIQSYRGNPKILNMAGERIMSIFGNNLERAFKNKTSIGLSFVLSTIDNVFLDLKNKGIMEICVFKNA